MARAPSKTKASSRPPRVRRDAPIVRGQAYSATRLAALLDVDPSQFDAVVASMLERDPEANRTMVRIADFELPRNDGEADTAYDRRREQALARIFEFLTRRAVRALTRCDHAVPCSNLSSSLDDGDLLATQLIRLRRNALPEGRTADTAYAAIQDLAAWRDRFAHEQTYLVPVLVEKYLAMGVDRDDLVQEGMLGLLRAIDGYDWRRGVRFSTYAKYWIQDRVLKSLYDQSRTVRLPAWIQKLWQKAYRKAAREDGTQNVLASEALASELDVSKRRLERVVSSRRRQISLDAPMPGDDDASFVSTLTDPSTVDFHMPSDTESLERTVHDVLASLDERERLIVSERFGFGGREPRSLREIGDELGISAERVRQIQAGALDSLRENRRVAALFETIH
ncbi:MAG: sigma-70 family RNA polymerase sigma factor [Planctomycetes bacterium]|nr:sigma-70 family RNA polymerase sigma factor [Planctomycetota bacterium]MCB9890363.1 sigma-70 family RNA polymerase sigma factor [Planctomycetota bacterium]MCB9918181.1 sigma-70 family RNA polymerase sigma factor [Planctomycetota bacterium]